MEPGTTAYTVPTALRLSGELNAAALERALGETVRRHQALRTVFPVGAAGGPEAHVLPFTGFTLPIEVPAAEGDVQAEVRRRALAETARPFDLAAGPLFRAVLLRLAADEHVLLITQHHAVTDGWSLGVMFRELSALYAAFARGEEPALAEPAVQYADYAAWQRGWLRGEVLAEQLGYWRGALAGAPALLELPTDRPRPAVRGGHGARRTARLPRALVDRLHALSRREGATLYMTMLAGFQLLLSRWSGQDDVVVATPVAGRTRGETEALIGLFVNTLAVRGDLAGDPTFGELLARTREATLGAFAHQELPFEKLVEELAPERSLSHAPLCQVMFALQNAAEPTPALDGLAVELLPREGATSKLDLTLHAAEDADGLELRAVFATALFDGATVERMLAQLAALLDEASAHPRRPVSQLALVDEDERTRVVTEWNRTETEFPAGALLHRMIEAQAARTPHAVAVVHEDESLTYAQLDARANQLAQLLHHRGIGPEVRVGVCMERSAELVVAILAVLKAGGAYVPLDPGYPAERLAHMLADSGVPVLLTVESVRDRLPAHGAETVCLDADAALIAAEPATAPACATEPEHGAYVIYTSGSTGQPKGVVIEHRNITNYVAGVLTRMAATPCASYALVSTVAADLGHTVLFPALCTGAALHVVSEERATDPEAFADYMERHGVEGMKIVPSHLQALQSGTRPAAVLPRRLLVLGGEGARREWIAKVREMAPEMAILNHYGPTEATVGVLTNAITGTPERAILPLGKPLPNSRVYVLDARMRVLPVGVPGELYVGGAGVARGYLNRPELTAERFIDSPFIDGDRLYRTGDRVRWLADGTLEFLGRVDDQVKIRGFRVELGEIEAALRQHPQVREAVVVAREDVPGDKRLAGYVVPEGEAPGVAALRGFLKDLLPDYMVPTAWATLDALPLNRNGKVDRRALPAPDVARGEGYVAPRTATEEVLAAVWAEVLRVERVGIEDNFFELGGHSLLATRVVSRIREVFRAELPLRALFEAPTVAALAERVEAARGTASAVPPVRPREDAAAPAPLSFAQERLWLLDQMAPGSAAYNVPTALRLSGALDAAVLDRALAEIVRRHQVLRTVFRVEGGRPVQTVLPATDAVLSIEDLSSLSADVREEQARERARDEARRPFDLTAGPLFRAALLRLADDEHLLLITLHHVASDGWSRGVLFGELSALYAAFAAGRPSPLAEPAVQYADFAAWQRAHLEGDALAADAAWWAARMAGAPALLELPADRPPPAVPTGRAGAHPVAVPAALASAVEALARAEGATPYMALLAAYHLLLSRWSGARDVVVGAPVAGRTRAEVEGLIGFFVNVLPVRAQVDPAQGFRALLAGVRDAVLETDAHQQLPFERLVEALDVPRSLSHAPVFQVAFTWQDAPADRLALPGITATSEPVEHAGAKYDLTLSLGRGAAGLGGALVYAADRFHAESAARMADAFLALLAAAAADPDAPVGALPLVDAAERERLLRAWNATGAPEAAPLAIHRRVEGRAAMAPDSPALLDDAGTLSYGELNARANRLARRLAALGAGPETRVALVAGRGAAQVTAALAVLKTGAAYVPVDPAYPAERIAFLLADSGARVVLAESHLAGSLAADVPVLVLEDTADRADESVENLSVDVAPENAAYVVYTSGSTGRPKGVAVEHRALANLVRWFNRAYEVTASDRGTLIAGPGFDATVFETWPFLAQGASVRVLTDEVRASVGAIQQTVLRDRVTVMWLPTPLTEGYLALDWPTDAPLRVVITGGDALRVRPTARHPFILVNNYGPTENAVVSTFGVVSPGGRGVPSIGRPVDATRAYVLDAALQPVPVGIPGELFVAGASLARGYLRRPAMTAERFVPDPFAGDAGARMYATGDRVRFRANGEIEFMGRTDFQVKVRGFRIEPGEVEAAISRAPRRGRGRGAGPRRRRRKAARSLGGIGRPGRDAGLAARAARRRRCRTTWSPRCSWCWSACR